MPNQNTALRPAEALIPRTRRVTQLAMLAVLGNWGYYGIFRCPFLVPFVNCQSCPVITCWGRITSYFWGFWLLLPLSVFFVGRAFCGWFCPGGFINQMIGKGSVFKLRVGNRLTRLAPIGLVIGIVIVMVLLLGAHNPRSMVPIRIGEFWGSLRLSFEHASTFWLIRTFAVIGLMAAGLIVANLWCRFVCPTGGVLELFKGMALFRMFKTSACNNCDACRRVCEMGTRPDELNCTNCGDCLKSCPVDAIKFGRKR